MLLEPIYERDFLDCSYGFRSGRSAHQALEFFRNQLMNCRGGWVLEVDIRKFFDNLDHGHLRAFLRLRVRDGVLLRLIDKWLKAGVMEDGSVSYPEAGTPQGGVVSPLLANLFLHHAFDEWMRRNHPSMPFERYADDVIVHAKSKAQAEQLLAAIRARLAECGLELHPEKTKIVYCQDSDRKGQHEHIQFDFLGYTFRPRRAKNHWGKPFVSFLPGVSNKAGKAIRATIRDWRLAATRNNQSLEDITQLVNPSVSGWANYYGRFYRSALTPVLRHLERALIRWVCRKYKRFRGHVTNAAHWLGRLARRDPNLFVLWQMGMSISEQQQKLNEKLRGHYAYYGVTGNSGALTRFLWEVGRRWRKWLFRRNRNRSMNWTCFRRTLQRYPLTGVRTVHSVCRLAANP